MQSVVPSSSCATWQQRPAQGRLQPDRHCRHARGGAVDRCQALAAGTDPGACASSRRQLLLCISAAGLTAQLPLMAKPAGAAGQLEAYEDGEDKFKLGIPSGWEAGRGTAPAAQGFGGASGVRRALAWYPPEDPDTNVTMVITNVGADFTSLGSFGDAEQFGTNVVAQMDRSWQNRSAWRPKQAVQCVLPSRVQLLVLGHSAYAPILTMSYANHCKQEAALLDAKKTLAGGKPSYFVEYTVTRPTQEQRHLYSLVSLGFNGRYNRLLTLTAQCAEAKADAYQSILKQVLQSFQPPPSIET